MDSEIPKVRDISTVQNKNYKQQSPENLSSMNVQLMTVSVIEYFFKR